MVCFGMIWFRAICLGNSIFKNDMVYFIGAFLSNYKKRRLKTGSIIFNVEIDTVNPLIIKDSI